MQNKKFHSVILIKHPQLVMFGEFWDAKTKREIVY